MNRPLPGGDAATIEGQLDDRVGAIQVCLNLYHVRHRALDPRDGRWLQRDPIGYAGGWNLYQYASGDPFVYADPSGCVPTRLPLSPGEDVTDKAPGTYYHIHVQPNGVIRVRVEVIRRTGLFGWGPQIREFTEYTGDDLLPNGIEAVRWAKAELEQEKQSGPIQTMGEYVAAQQIVVEQGGAMARDALAGEIIAAGVGATLRAAAAGMAARQCPRELGAGPRLTSAHDIRQKITWLDEASAMRADARQYQSSAPGARSNPLTKKPQAPAIEGSRGQVRFDGVHGLELIDRKLRVVSTAKGRSQALRQSEALRRNSLSARWEVPTRSEAERASRLFKMLGIRNIRVVVVPNG